MTVKRKESIADIYHVVSRGTGRQIIFEDDSDRSTYLRILTHAKRELNTELYAWCLMSNHVHLVVHAPLDTLSVLMRIVNGTYARTFNKKACRTGHLFQERYLSEPVNDDEYLITVVRYVHANPKKAGIAETEHYDWSSYKEYLEEPVLATTSFVLDIFGSTEAFRRFHQGFDGADMCLDIDSPRNATRPMPDDLARRIAEDELNGLALDELKRLSVKERNLRLALLKGRGLSVKQIERLTGIGRGSVQRA